MRDGGLPERLYRRFGPRVFLLAIAATVIEVAVSAVVIAVACARYIHVSVSLVALWFPIVVGLALLVVVLRRSVVATILAWSGDGRTPLAVPATLEALARVPRVILEAGGAATVGTGFGLVDILVTDHIPGWGIVPVCTFGLVMGPAATLSVVFPTIDLLIRPMLEDVLAHAPAGAEVRPQGFGIRTKVFAPLPILTVFGMLVVGAWSNAASNGLVRLSISLGISAVAVAVASVVFAAAIRAVLDPVDDLIAATRRVRAGDLETRIPIRGTDELAALTSSFNQMLEGLQERERLDAELRASRERIVSTADAARRRIERDLHDGAQQHLVLLGLRLGQARRLIRSDPDAAEKLHDEVGADLEHALAELRDLAHGIYPAALSSDGLPGALKEAVGRAGIQASLACDGAGRYRPEVEAAVYFTCVEALQNAAKHAGPDARAQVRLSHGRGALEFEVADDGAGFDAAGVSSSGGGLQNMADRIGALGGSLAIESAPGSGTRVAGAIPLASGV